MKGVKTSLDWPAAYTCRLTSPSKSRITLDVISTAVYGGLLYHHRSYLTAQ